MECPAAARWAIATIPSQWLMATELFRALCLGLLQGLTEFLPVSSSGHLVLLPALLGWPSSTLLFAIVVHWGTLTALIAVYAGDIRRMITGLWRSVRLGRWADYSGRDGAFIILATLPAGLGGILLKPVIEDAMERPLWAGAGLLITALLLAGGEVLAARRGRYRYAEEMTLGNALQMGVGQALALLPGISRSGAVMAFGRMQGLERPGVARFAFLLGIPAIAAAGVWELISLEDPLDLLWGQEGMALLVGFLASAGAGFLAIKGLLRFVRRYSFVPFALYCLAVGGYTLYRFWP